MSRATRRSEESQHDVTLKPGPITKVPLEIVTEIFKFVVFSSEEARSHGVKDLCLVGQDWNHVAKVTPDLWTKVTLAYPFHAGQLSAAQKWLKTSEQKAIDVEIDLCDSAWDKFGEEAFHPLEDPAQLQGMIAVLRGSEHRWRSITIKSDVWRPIHEFLRAWAVPSLPLLESISFERCNELLGGEYIPWAPRQSFESPILFGGNGTFMPKLREVTLSAVHVDWASTATSFRDLRKLEIKNQHYEVGPTFEQFSALLAASPRLEFLDVTGYYPNPEAPNVADTLTETSLVHLPALKHLVFGWSRIEFACYFLMSFQIPESLNTLSLIDTESGLGVCQEEETGLFTYNDTSTPIFELLAYIGPSDPGNKDLLSSRVSLLGLKSLSVSWAEADPRVIVEFLKRVPMIEEIRLTDVGQGILQGIVIFAGSQSSWSLKKIHIRWIWNGGHESHEAGVVTQLLRGRGFEVTVEKFTGQDRGSTPVAPEALFSKKAGERRP